ncbi:MAG TPA: hypothetical protein VNY52_04185 [Solirubrobacteraceae bacterium]|nr:hypothetical protein [Solirubrobacteraceae bacterium]
MNTVSAPAASAGGEGKLVVEVSNLGDAMVNATTHSVTVVDTLPAGVTATSVHGEGSGGGVGELIGHEDGTPMPCAVDAQTVRCTFNSVLLAYERLMIAIDVSVEPGAGGSVNEVGVSGGGTSPVLSRRALALESVQAYGVENYELTPEDEGGAPDTQAGSHPFQLTTTFTLNTRAALVKHSAFSGHLEEIVPEVQPVGLVKDLRFDTPAGLVGNPTPLPKCSLYLFLHNSRECPDDTIVGVSTPIVSNPSITANVPLAGTVPLYSLEPAVGEPARFGFLEPLGPTILDISVSGSGSGYHVVVTVPDILDDDPVIGSQVTFWGVPVDPRHDTTRGACLAYASTPEEVLERGELSCPVQEKPQPLLTLPTSCTGPLQGSLQSDSWENIGVYSPPKEYSSQSPTGEAYGQDGCNRLSFEPAIGVAPDGQQASTPTGLSVDEHIPQTAGLNPSGLAQSTVKDTTVALPAGVAIDPSGGDGLSACGQGEGPGEIRLGSPAEQECRESAKIGTVEVHTPLLPNPLVGAAYLAQQEANPFGSLVAMYIAVYDPVSGVRIKVAGEVRPDPVTGQLVATFDDTPQLPFEDLILHFFGGSRAPLGTPALCGGYTTTASITPWSGGEPVGSSSEFKITSGPNGTPCPNPPGDQSPSTLPFAPTLTTGSLNIQAGAFTPFTMTMSREDGNKDLKAIRLSLPPGLSGALTGVALCPEPQADQGTCGPESLIGETTVSVGLGGNPFTVKGGKVYITGPYEGAPFGLSIVNPAKAGPFDLEHTAAKHPACDCLVVRAKVEVNPSTAALTITSNSTEPYAIPAILEGIPLQIKHVNVTINRPGFTFNPTDCNPMQITGSLQSSEGASSSLSVPYQVTDCAALKFAPKFAVSTSARTSRADGASLTAKLSYPNVGGHSIFASGQANIARVKVELPKQLPSRLTTLQKACTIAQFEANPAGCPTASFIGHAKATTPLLPVPLEGPAIFVSHGGEAFPSLEVVLQGYGVTIDLVGSTFISKAGITSSTFKTVPDAPVGSFELTLPEGPFSALTADGNLCQSASKLKMPTEFVAQSGKAIHESTKIAVGGCPKTKRAQQRRKAQHKTGKGKLSARAAAQARPATASSSAWRSSSPAPALSSRSATRRPSASGS